MNCPAPLKPRDFVLMRSWLDTGPRGEAMLISRSVEHRDYPPKKGFIRAFSHLTGFVLRPHGQDSCILSYVTHCDPQGALPPWLVNKVTHTFGPRMIKDLQKASVGYLAWKTERNLYWKPWRFPEQIDKPRISIEEVRGTKLLLVWWNNYFLLNFLTVFADFNVRQSTDRWSQRRCFQRDINCSEREDTEEEEILPIVLKRNRDISKISMVIYLTFYEQDWTVIYCILMSGKGCRYLDYSLKWICWPVIVEMLFMQRTNVAYYYC